MKKCFKKSDKVKHWKTNVKLTANIKRFIFKAMYDIEVSQLDDEKRLNQTDAN